jgi:two-component system sensor histidine kinase HydH
MLTRRLALALLAPTVLVSLALVGACIFGVLYLNYLHVGVAKDFSENRESQLAATVLETTTRDLINLLRGDHADDDKLVEHVREKNDKAEEQLAEAKRLANHDEEIMGVGQVREGLDSYFAKWKKRPEVPVEKVRAYDATLADGLENQVLAPCIKLREYNTEQVAGSDRQNRRIVLTLTWVLLLVGLGAPLSGLLLGYAIARNLDRSIYQLRVRVRDAAGRLNRDLGSVTLQEKGDLPGLHQQLQGVIDEIERAVGQLQQREREMLHAEQLTALGQVAAGVAHELRNPLTSVKMLVQTGLEGDTGLPADDLAIVEHEVKRMETCIQTFLDFARPPRAERRRTDLDDRIRRALALIEGRARRQGVALNVELPPAPVSLEIDPEQIQQVLLNLLLNALDAMPGGGAVRLSVSRASLSVDGNGHTSEGPAVEVRIQDTGPGIAPHIRQRLFEPFVSSKETGLGLGLSICKRLIEAHGGTICGENAREGGAVFRFRLPVPSATAQTTQDGRAELQLPLVQEG